MANDDYDNLPPGMCLEWKNLTYSVPSAGQSNYNFWQSCQKKKELRILKDVSGHMNTGDLVAILGCSGAGKTTLLAAISQRLRGNLSGDIVLNGMAIDRSEMTRISSFLPQFEINVKTFTAFEHLYFMSHFKMHRNTTKEQKTRKVNDLLMIVGLRDASNTKIKHLSGGERKRLSLAEELITDPIFLFCDEPTTGLDSYSAHSVVKTLRNLCTRQRIERNSISNLYDESSSSSSSNNSVESQSGSSSIEMEAVCNVKDSWLRSRSGGRRLRKSVICSIHQPTSDIFELFTHLILMDAGHIIYQGSTKSAYNFFVKLGYHFPLNCNPADFYLKTISDSHTGSNDGEIVKRKYESETNGLYSGSWLLGRIYNPDYMHKINNFKKIRWPYQVLLLLDRFVTEDRRKVKDGLTALGMFMITSFTMAIMYSGVQGLTQLSVQDISGSIFVLTTEIIFTTSYSVTYVFPTTLPIIRREVGEGIYSLSAYFVAAVLSRIPSAFFMSYLFLSVVYLASNYYSGLMLYLSMGLVLGLSAVAGTGYGIFLSSLFESERLASEMAAPFDLLFLIFGGMYYNVDSLPFLKYISMFFYSNEALNYDFWIGVREIDCPQNMNHPCDENGIEVLRKRSFQTGPWTFWIDCFGLVVVAIVFNVIAYFFIRKYVKRSGYY